MDWSHYVLVSVNLCLLLLVIAESLPPWVTRTEAGPESMSVAGLAAAGGAGGSFRGGWGPLFPLPLRNPLLVAYNSDATGDSNAVNGAAATSGPSTATGDAAAGAAAICVASGVSDGSVAQPRRRRVCWTSSGDYSSPSPSGVVIHGPGCATCLRGQRCSFRVSVRVPAHWAHVLKAESWWKRDLTLTLRGSALAHGDIRCLDPPHCTEFRVSYRVWDLGNY
ncbi:unnamed protein product, partial [Closterium sp. NIES-54]